MDFRTRYKDTAAPSIEEQFTLLHKLTLEAYNIHRFPLAKLLYE